MDSVKIKRVLTKLAKKQITPREAFHLLKSLPYEDIGCAKIDHHRSIRTGFPEAVYCQGKTPEQIVKIISALSNKSDTVLATRAAQEVYDHIKTELPKAVYHKEARIIAIQKKSRPHPVLRTPLSFRRGAGGEALNKTIAVITAGTADIPVAEEAAVTAQYLGNNVEKIYDVGVAGIHRLLNNLNKINKASVIIVVAGMEGALASVVGGLVDVPVIAVPTSIGYGASFQGLAALLSMLNSCAPGVSVVNIDNGFGAGCMASIILNSKK